MLRMAQLDPNRYNRRSVSMTRRSLLAQAAAPAFLAGQAADRPPNIVYIICDQMRGDAMGCVGHRDVRTPNLDRMAREGVLFERCSVNSPVCVPSRKSAFSGRYPHEHGSLTNRQKPLLGYGDSMLEYFARSGYRTGWVGKNHTFEKPGVERLDFASIRDREPFRRYNGTVPAHWHADVYWPEEDCYPAVNTNEAVRFLDEQNPRDPFFLHVSYFDPHPPYMAPSEFTSRYDPWRFDLPDAQDAAAMSPRLDEFRRAFGLEHFSPAELRETMRFYYAQIEWGVDKQVGLVLDALRRRGMDDETVVVFTSDHGDFMGSHGLVRKGMFLYDALLHVPMIWRAPGRLAAGLRTRAAAQHIDLFPTFADFAGKPTGLDLPGRSLRPAMEGAQADPTRLTYTSAAYGELTEAERNLPIAPTDASAKPRHTQALNRNMAPEQRTSMVRNDEWKLILNESCGPELYRMAGGVRESRNLADEPAHAGVRRDLDRRLSAWWAW